MSLFSTCRPILYISLAACLAWAGGCGQQSRELETEYGKRHGRSINGTGVFADMFEANDFDVETSDRWSPRMERADVIVWFPDSYAPPSEETVKVIEEWLAGEGWRRLIYVRRDYDGESAYWKQVVDRVPAEQRSEVIRREAVAARDHFQRRQRIPEDKECNWFHVKRNDTPQKITNCRGIRVNDENLKITLQSEIELPGEVSEDWEPGTTHNGDYYYDADLFGNEKVLIMRTNNYKWNENEIVVVANSSMLTNAALVNSENQIIADTLIADCQDFGLEHVVFLESDSDGLVVRKEDPKHPTGLEPFTVWPINALIIHLMILGILFCFAWFPIFGRARKLPEANTADFGKHLDALTRLLWRRQDATKARWQIDQYHARARKESGAAHREEVVPDSQERKTNE